MKLSTKFILFIIVIHAATVGLSFYIFEKNRIYFLVSEALVLISLSICWSLYQEMIRPLQLLLRGVDAIRDRDFNVKFVKTGKYEMDRLIEVYNHMIDELRRERIKQEEQHFFLEKLVQTSPTGIIILDYDNNISAVNPRAAELTGFRQEQAQGKPVSGFRHPVFEAVAHLPTGESRTLNIEGPRTFKIVKSRFIDRGFPRDFVMIEELTAEILAAEKRSYGKVIRMMAHEVNNSIGAVNSILDTTLQMQPPGSDIGHALGVAIERNEHLNRFMRNFADVIRLPQPRPEALDLSELLQKTSQLLEYKARAAGVELRLETNPPGRCVVQADGAQMEQVLINVVKNAVESCEKGGTVMLRCGINPPFLEVADNGRGISKDVEDKLFSPFFSSKQGGQGIGLTLAREILGAHGFRFSLKTGEDGWTRFWIGPT